MTTNTDTIHARIRRARAAIGIVTHDGKVTTGRTSYDYVSHQRLLAAVDPALDAEGLYHSQSVTIGERYRSTRTATAAPLTPMLNSSSALLGRVAGCACSQVIMVLRAGLPAGSGWVIATSALASRTARATREIPGWW